MPAMLQRGRLMVLSAPALLPPAQRMVLPGRVMVSSAAGVMSRDWPLVSAGTRMVSSSTDEVLLERRIRIRA